MSFKSDMRKIMLTVFKHNKEAEKFFRAVMKFETDETSPVDDVYEQVGLKTGSGRTDIIELAWYRSGIE